MFVPANRAPFAAFALPVRVEKSRTTSMTQQLGVQPRRLVRKLQQSPRLSQPTARKSPDRDATASNFGAISIAIDN